MLITRSKLQLIDENKAALYQAFKMKDLEELKYLLGTEFDRSKQDILMHHKKYALEFSTELGLEEAKPAPTSLKINVNLLPKSWIITQGIQANKSKSSCQMLVSIKRS